MCVMMLASHITLANITCVMWCYVTSHHVMLASVMWLAVMCLITHEPWHDLAMTRFIQINRVMANIAHVWCDWLTSHMCDATESHHTCLPVTSHMSMRLASCHTCQWVWGHVAHVIESWVMSHVWMIYESCHKCKCVMGHVTHINESCHTCKWVMSHM